MSDAPAIRTTAKSHFFLLDNFFRPLLVLDRELNVLWGNRCYYELFRTTPRETEGVLFSRLGDGEWDIQGLTERLAAVAASGRTDLGDWEVSRFFNKLGPRSMLLNARQMNLRRSTDGCHILLAIEDITDRKQREEKLRTNK